MIKFASGVVASPFIAIGAMFVLALNGCVSTEDIQKLKQSGKQIEQESIKLNTATLAMFKNCTEAREHGLINVKVVKGTRFDKDKDGIACEE